MNESAKVKAEPTTSPSPSPNPEGTLPRAGGNSNENISIVENKGTGDAWQIIASTNGDNIQGKNEGDGWRTRQFAGNCNDATLQQISGDMVSIGLQDPRYGGPKAQARTTLDHENIEKDEAATKYTNQYGPGHTT